MGKSGDYGGISPKSECGELGPGDIGVSGIGTVAAANVVPGNRPPDESFIVVSMYARWMMPHPITGSPWSVGASDVSVHRIISDLSAFIGHVDPSKHRILAAGDLNTIHGASAGSLSLVDRERTVWVRMEMARLEFIGPQLPNGWPANSPRPDVPDDTNNAPMYRTTRQSPADANRQLDYAFASRRFHDNVRVRARNGIDEWGSSDHCRLFIDVEGHFGGEFATKARKERHVDKTRLLILRVEVQTPPESYRLGGCNHFFLMDCSKRTSACCIRFFVDGIRVLASDSRNRFSMSHPFVSVVPIRLRVLADFDSSTSNQNSRALVAIVFISGIMILA